MMQAPTFSIVRIDQIHEIIAPVVEPFLQPLGFEVQAPLTWLRSEDAPIRQIFCLKQWKGGALAPAWGLSLDFVPHLSGNQIKWHRTPKSARLDLTWDVRDRAMDISYMYGPEVISRVPPRIVGAAVAKAETFWSSARAVSDLPQAFEQVKQHLSSGRVGFYNYLQHPLAYAFVLAMNGKPDAAEAELQRFTASLSVQATEKLHAVFADLVRREGHVHGKA